jgi:hypothetical protein
MSSASQEARSGAERRRWFAAASAAVERRQASAPLPASPYAGEGREIRAREGLRVCRRFAFLIYEPGAIEMDAGTTAGAGRRDRVRSFSFFVEQNSGAARRENAFAWSLRAPASNPALCAGAGLVRRGACHRAGRFGPDPLAPRNAGRRCGARGRRFTRSRRRSAMRTRHRASVASDLRWPDNF